MMRQKRHRLRSARQAKGWSRREAAAQAGVSHRTWEAWELGRRTPPMQTAARVAALLGVDIDVWCDELYGKEVG